MTDEFEGAVNPVFTTHSDDCASIKGRHNIDESALWGVWLPLRVNGVVIGEVMVDYGDGWEFHVRGGGGYFIEVLDDPALVPSPDDDD